MPEDAVESLCTALSKLLAPGSSEEVQDDGKDYVVELRDIRLGFGARMLLHKTDLILERNHRYKTWSGTCYHALYAFDQAPHTYCTL